MWSNFKASHLSLERSKYAQKTEVEMQQYELIVPCHFGLESIVKREIYDIGYEIKEVQDGRVTFLGDAEAIVRANIWLRSAERVLLKVGSFHAETYEELFQGTMALPWEDFLEEDSRFWVTKAASVKSKLFSPSDIQSVMKKAMVERMKKTYHIQQFPETGADFPVRVFLHKDEVTVSIDTTGESLHKRGYRKYKVAAPIAENLAAGLIALTPWRPGRILVDPFCGSGTFLIESAMIAANIAPGLYRNFLSEKWTSLIPSSLWREVSDEAGEMIDMDVQTDLQGYDIDPEAIAAARQNAKLAGVDKLIHFQTRSVERLSHPKKYGFIITNPPYGERLTGDEINSISKVYGDLGAAFKKLDSWSMYLITSYQDCEKALNIKATKNRKIYNGMLKTYFYQFPGPRPPKKRS